MRRLARVVLLVGAVITMLAGSTPSAHAVSTGAFVFTGTANVGPAIAFPCVGVFGGFDPTKCPVGVGSGNGVMLPTKTKPAHPFPTQGNAAATTFNGSAAGALMKVAKAKCAGTCVEAGTFSITDVGGGFVTGWCTLAWGKLNGIMAPAIALGTKANTRTVTVNLLDVGGLLVLTGATSNNEWLAGVALAINTDGNCRNKIFAKQFTVLGAFAVVGQNAL